MVEECGPCAKGPKSFVQMRAHIAQANEKGLLQNIPVEMMVALGIKESHGRMYFSPKDEQYEANMRTLVHSGKVARDNFLRMIVDEAGPHKGLISKFRYEPDWRATANNMVAVHDMPAQWRILLSCSFGYFQKGMCWHMSAKKPEAWAKALHLFLHDSDEQCRVAANDITILIKNAKGDVPLAFSRYNAGPTHPTVTEYGRRVWELYKHETGL